MQMQFTGKYLAQHMRFQYENVSYNNARLISSGPNLHQRFVVCCVSIELIASDGIKTKYATDNNSLKVIQNIASATAHVTFAAVTSCVQYRYVTGFC